MNASSHFSGPSSQLVRGSEQRKRFVAGVPVRRPIERTHRGRLVEDEGANARRRDERGAKSDHGTVRMPDEVHRLIDRFEQGDDLRDVDVERKRVRLGLRSGSPLTGEIGHDRPKSSFDEAGGEASPLSPAHAAAMKQDSRRSCSHVLDIEASVRAAFRRRLAHSPAPCAVKSNAHASLEERGISRWSREATRLRYGFDGCLKASHRDCDTRPR